MASDRPDPESYSLDEMMQRLRSRGIESEPELITRPDGTQVYRVRKRKRRTRQPHKEQQRRRQRMRVFQIGAAVVLVMVLATAAVAMFAYYNSGRFVAKLGRRIGGMTGAEAEFQQFRVTPVRAMAGAVALRWPGGGGLGELQLQQVSADLRITSFVGGTWNGEEVFARNGVLYVGDQGLAAAAPEPVAPGEVPPFSFTRYRCESLGVMFGGGLRPPLQCREVEASFYALPAGGQLRLNGGRLLVAGWPELPIDRGLVEFRDGRVVVSSIQIGGDTEQQGRAELRGEVDPGGSQPAALEVTLERFPLRLLAGDKAARIFNTRLDAAATLSFVPGRFESHELVVPFEASSASNGVYVSGFPFLQVLRSEFQNEEFGSRPFTTEAGGTLRRTAGAVVLEELNLLEKNFLALRGKLRIEVDGRLGGALDVGIAEAYASRHPSPVFRRVFAREEEGFCWARVTVSGTVQNPADDFAELAKQAASEPAAAEGGEVPPDVLEQTFRELIEGGAPALPPEGEGQPAPDGEPPAGNR